VTPTPSTPGEYSAVDLSLSGETLLARLEQGCVSGGTSVAIVHRDRYDLDLTVAEAAQLSAALAALVRQATAAMPIAPAV
jgi:hypothetical protein